MSFENPSPWCGVAFIGLLVITIITMLVDMYKDDKEDKHEK